MEILEGILSSYSALRKRRYSLSERILQEEGQKHNSFFNAVLGPRGLGAKGTEDYISKLQGLLTTLGNQKGQQVTLQGMGNKDKTALAEDFMADIEIRLQTAMAKEPPAESEGGDPETEVIEDLPPQAPLPPSDLTNSLDSAFEKWVSPSGRLKPNGDPRSIEKDMETLGKNMNGGGVYNSLRIFIDAFNSSKDEGMWGSEIMLKKGAEELYSALDVLSKIADSATPSDKCVNLESLSSKERSLLENFKFSGSRKSRGVWWGGDSILAGRATSDHPDGAPGKNSSESKGVRAFGENTAVFRIVEALSKKPICQTEEEVSQNLPVQSVIPITGGGDSWVRATLGLADEDLSTLSEWMIKRRNNIPLSPGENSESLNTLKGILLKLSEKNLSQVIDFVVKDSFEGKIPKPGDEVLEHPFMSSLKDAVEELKTEFPSFDWDAMTGNQVLLMYFAKELRGRQNTTAKWGFNIQEEKSNAAGVMKDEKGGIFKRTADTTINKTDRVSQIEDYLTPEGLECLESGLDPVDHVTGKFGLSKKQHRSGKIDSGGVAGNTVMGELGEELIKRKLEMVKAQSECFSASPGAALPPVSPERLSQIESFALQETRDEAEVYKLIGDTLAEDPKILRQTLEDSKTKGGYQTARMLDAFSSRISEIEDLKAELQAASPQNTRALEIEYQRQVLLFQKDWIGERRKLKLLENPDMMAPYLALQSHNSGASTSNQMIEINTGGGDVLTVREAVSHGSLLYRVMTQDPTLRVSPAGSRGVGGAVDFIDTETGAKATLDFRFHGGKKSKGRNRQQLYLTDEWTKQHGKKDSDIVQNIGQAPEVTGLDLSHKLHKNITDLVQTLVEDLIRESKNILQKV